MTTEDVASQLFISRQVNNLNGKIGKSLPDLNQFISLKQSI